MGGHLGSRSARYAPTGCAPVSTVTGVASVMVKLSSPATTDTGAGTRSRMVVARRTSFGSSSIPVFQISTAAAATTSDNSGHVGPLHLTIVYCKDS